MQGRPTDPKRAEPRYYEYLNCPDPTSMNASIDNDVQAVMLHRVSDERTIIVAAQQMGKVYALDPDREGAVLWELYPGAEERANITFGGATDGKLAYFPILFQPPVPYGGAGELMPGTPGTMATGALAAIRVGTGELTWYTPTPEPNCPKPMTRACSEYGSGQNGAATVIPGVVFAGAMGGMLRAYSTDDGQIIWEYDTTKEFMTVNHVTAKGGSLNGPGPTVVNGMLFMGSGINSGPGNVLLAFGIE